MSVALGKKLRRSGDRVNFFCPGCKDWHCIPVGGNLPGDKWTFNGDGDHPTFQPSILVRTGHHAPSWKPGDDCWCTWDAENPDDPAPFKCMVCHTYVTDGRIQFLNDCTHHLVGQTVDLPDHPHVEETPAPENRED